MYRLANETCLKKYYYKLTGPMLYVYRKKTDLTHKSALSLTKALILKCHPEVEGHEDSKRIHALKVIQPSGKARVFYFLEEKEREAWRVKLLSATGQRGEFFEIYDTCE